MAFAQNIRSKLFAGALSIGLAFGAAAPTMAQDTSANENCQHTTQQTNIFSESITHEQAQELSHGKVLLLYGEGFSQLELKNNIRHLKEAGLEVVAYKGAPDNKITPYIFGNHYPNKYYDASEAVVMAITLVEIAKTNNLIASINTPERS